MNNRGDISLYNYFKLMLIVCLMGASNQVLADGFSQAEDLINQYHSALQNGDTQTILSLFGPDEQQANEFLSEPRYQSLLIEEYQHSHLVIVGVEKQGLFYVVDYDIRLNPVGIISERALIRELAGEPGDGLKIFSKQPL